MSDVIAAATVSAEIVREVLDTELPDEDLNLAINVASRFVTAVLGSSGLAVATLTDIEMYLAAHFASLKDPRAESENIGGEYSYKTQGKTDMNLAATFYGQTALLLDTTGALDTASANLKKVTVKSLSVVNTLPAGWQNNPL